MAIWTTSKWTAQTIIFSTMSVSLVSVRRAPKYSSTAIIDMASRVAPLAVICVMYLVCSFNIDKMSTSPYLFTGAHSTTLSFYPTLGNEHLVVLHAFTENLLNQTRNCAAVP